MLKKSNAYMLRNDGKVIDCGRIHPYIIQHTNQPLRATINTLFLHYTDWLKWFYDNTQYSATKDRILGVIQFLADLVYSTEEGALYDSLGVKNVGELSDVTEIFKITPVKKDIEVDGALFTLSELLNELNFAANQEFLRFRFSSLYVYAGESGDIFFRVSSINFNWFPLIWNVVQENSAITDTVTIVADRQSLGGSGSGEQYYRHKGKLIQWMPTDEFLSLGGEPVIEGKSLFEEFGDYGAYHNNANLQSLSGIYIEKNFGRE